MKGVIISFCIALLVGLLAGYSGHRIKTTYDRVQLVLSSEKVLGNISMELERYFQNHGAYPEALADVSLDGMSLTESERRLAQETFYLRQPEDSYTLVLGFSGSAWVEPGKNVAFR